MVFVYALVSVIIVSLISLIGFLAVKESFMHKFLLYFVSFSAGALFADAFVHLLPEVVEQYGFTLEISLFVLVGLMFSFIVETFIHWRHCHLTPSKEHVHSFAYMNLVGDFVHNIIDGLVIGASYLLSIPVGIATTLAVVFHEIPQELGDFAILIHGGFTKKRALLLNFLTALSAVLGVLIVFLVGNVEGMLKFLIPFAAGGFIYIAGSDLIPELHKCDLGLKHRLLQLFCFIIGILVMLLLLVVG